MSRSKPAQIASCLWKHTSKEANLEGPERWSCVDMKPSSMTKSTLRKATRSKAAALLKPSTSFKACFPNPVTATQEQCKTSCRIPMDWPQLIWLTALDWVDLRISFFHRKHLKATLSLEMLEKCEEMIKAMSMTLFLKKLCNRKGQRKESNFDLKKVDSIIVF